MSVLPFIVLGLLIGYLWQARLKLDKFMIDNDHSNKLIFGLCASLADKYKSNVWIVRLLAVCILNFGYFEMYILLDKRLDQSPNGKKTTKEVKFEKKD
jgi:phage shock protein PspC (stress-responsive transcriptional regulator)